MCSFLFLNVPRAQRGSNLSHNKTNLLFLQQKIEKNTIGPVIALAKAEIFHGIFIEHL